MIVVGSKIMILKIHFGLSVFLAIHSMNMMHMCHVEMKCINEGNMPSDFVGVFSGNYSAWCVSAVISSIMALIGYLAILRNHNHSVHSTNKHARDRCA